MANWDNGRTWSTQWVIDDPKIFVIPPEGQTVAQLYRVKKQPQKRQQVSRSRTRKSNPSNAAFDVNFPRAKSAVKCGDGRRALGILDRRRWHVYRLPGKAPGRLAAAA